MLEDDEEQDDPVEKCYEQKESGEDDKDHNGY